MLVWNFLILDFDISLRFTGFRMDTWFFLPIFMLPLFAVHNWRHNVFLLLLGLTAEGHQSSPLAAGQVFPNNWKPNAAPAMRDAEMLSVHDDCCTLNQSSWNGFLFTPQSPFDTCRDSVVVLTFKVKGNSPDMLFDTLTMSSWFPLRIWWMKPKAEL